ncbi:MAG: septum formation initiator family protein [Desulfobacterales bacterium]
MISREKILLSTVIVLLLTILWMAIFGEKGLTDYYQLRKELAFIVEENEKVAHENKLFLQEIDRLKNDLDYIESVARKELGFVLKDEVIFQTKTPPLK